MSSHNVISVLNVTGAPLNSLMFHSQKFVGLS